MIRSPPSWRSSCRCSRWNGSGSSANGAPGLKVGSVSINDGGLTTEVFDAEKNPFNLSGLGASRMGASGLLRFLRSKALLIQHGKAKDLSAFEESRAEAE